MKTKVILTGFCLAFLLPFTVNAQVWTNTNAPWSVANNATSGTGVYEGNLYVGTYNDDRKSPAEVWKFDGETWTNTMGPWPVAYSQVTSFAVYGGNLYAGLYSYTGSMPGGVWRYNGTAWTNTNVPWSSAINGVESLAVFGGNLYAGTVRQVWKYDGTTWTNTNIPWTPDNIITFSLAVYGGNLYAGSESTATPQVWRYDGSTWNNTNPPWAAVNDTVSSMAVYGAYLYASVYDNAGGQLWRYNGTTWTNANPPWSATSPYALLTVHGADLYAGTEHAVWKFDGTTWTNMNAPASLSPSSIAGYGPDVYLGTWGDQKTAEVWRIPTTQPTLVPDAGTIGTEITLTGSGFGAKRGKVLLGTTALKVMDWTDDTIRCQLTRVPSPGTYDVTVQPQGKGVSPIRLPNSFTVEAPEIGSVNPTSGSVGDEITIDGLYFGTKKGKVTLGGKNCRVLAWTMDPASGEGVVQFVVPRGLASGTRELKIANGVESDITDFVVQ